MDFVASLWSTLKGEDVFDATSPQVDFDRHVRVAVVTFVLLLVLNELLKFKKNVDATTRYFILHILINGFVSVVHFDEVIQVYKDPVNSYKGHCDSDGVIAIIVLHLFHIAFWQPLVWIDWVHHIVMIIILAPAAYLLQPGALLGHGSWFTSGFPGGVDYILLVAVKMGYMDSITEKRINARIQTWLRAPGCVFHALLSWICWVHLSKGGRLENALVPSWAIGPCITIVIVTFFWNGPFFNARVRYNLGEKELLLKLQKEGRLLPKSKATSKADGDQGGFNQKLNEKLMKVE